MIKGIKRIYNRLFSSCVKQCCDNDEDDDFKNFGKNIIKLKELQTGDLATMPGPHSIIPLQDLQLEATLHLSDPEFFHLAFEVQQMQ